MIISPFTAQTWQVHQMLFPLPPQHLHLEIVRLSCSFFQTIQFKLVFSQLGKLDLFDGFQYSRCNLIQVRPKTGWNFNILFRANTALTCFYFFTSLNNNKNITSKTLFDHKMVWGHHFIEIWLSMSFCLYGHHVLTKTSGSVWQTIPSFMKTITLTHTHVM